MARSFPRSDRIADLIKQEVATLLINGVKDPRVSGVTVTDVRVTDDLRKARIYFVSPEKNRSNVISGLEKAKGYIRSVIAKNIRMRRIPDFEFFYDDVFENGIAIEQKLRDIRNKDDNK